LADVEFLVFTGHGIVLFSCKFPTTFRIPLSKSESGSIQPVFSTPSPEKRLPYSRFYGLSGIKWVRVGVKTDRDSRAFGGHSLTSKSGVFWQTELKLSLFSTRTEKNVFTCVPGTGPDQKKGIGAQFGLVFPTLFNPTCLEGLPKGSEVLFCHIVEPHTWSY